MSRHEHLMMAAKIEVCLMTEFLAPLDVRPDWLEAVWVMNAERGPSLRGIERLRAVQEVYGSANVTTGNAVPLSSTEVGIYVRPDVLARSALGLLGYLS